MKELLRRLFARPFLAFEVLAATFFIALFNLASPVFVINVLNRYVTYGFDGTLITLTAGMLIAVVLQYGFRVVRTRLLGEISTGPDSKMSMEVLEALSRTRAGALDRIPNARLQETVGSLQTVQAAYDTSNFTAFLDAPFSLLYILTAFLLSSILGWISLFGILCALGIGALSIKTTRKTTEALQSLSTAHRGVVSSAVQASDTVRAFEARTLLTRIWEEQVQRINALRLNLANRKEQSQSLTQAASLLMSVALYAVGAVLVVAGSLTVGALIGANILASRAFQNIVRFVQTNHLLSRAREAHKELEEFLGLPKEPDRGTAVRQYNGTVGFRDLAFAYPGNPGPLFESLNLDLDPGSILVVTGRNGAGKTTLAKLLVGLLAPTRGEILADGISLRQVAPVWWRRQIMYFPQEPTFIMATIRENITLLNPGIEEGELNQVIRLADLRPFLDRTPDGIETRLPEAGRHLSLGIRRRLALARALATGGILAVFDEPTEGLDTEGCEAVYQVLNALVKVRKTIVAFSNDPLITKAANLLLDLNQKPVPRPVRAGGERKEAESSRLKAEGLEGRQAAEGGQSSRLKAQS